MFKRRKGLKGHNGFCDIRSWSFVLAVLLVPWHNVLAQDSENYLNKAWRDSVANYSGRVEAYHQELLSYDWGMTFGMLPVAGEAYVGKAGTGIAYFAARGVAVAAGVVGAVRFIEGKPNFGLNLGMIAVGIFGYIGLKLSELADIRQTVSERNEDFVEHYHIEIPDIEPHSIRYPSKQWPDWITSWPPIPPKVETREAINQPLPKVTSKE
ncbi:MAG TPA: hypothetical protein VFD13_01125 [Candidatus Kapabacteria bacterium]|nr:hypothetical protein [Candidatus Kapabacteria bacterium]